MQLIFRTAGLIVGFLALVVTLAMGIRAAEAGTQSSDQEVVLTITAPNLPAAGKTYTMAELKALPQTGFTTSTVWTEGKHRFDGVALSELLADSGAKGDTISAIALNDYAITLPTADVEAAVPIVALAMDGQAMSRRTKGPLWVVYPYDSDPKYQSETVYGRSIWQLLSLAVK